MKKTLTLMMIFTVLSGFLAPAFGDVESSIIWNKVEYNLPGVAVAVEQNGKLLYYDTFGFEDDLEDPDFFWNKGMIQTGEMGQWLTSFALLKLLDDQEISTQETIGTYLPRDLIAPHFDELTFEVLLMHQTGLPQIASQTASKLRLPFQENKPLSAHHIQFVENHIKKDLSGKVYPVNRSFLNTSLQVILIEALSGQSYENYLRQAIFQPLGMTSSQDFLINENLDQYPYIVPRYDVRAGIQQASDPFHAHLIGANDWITTPRDLFLFLRATQNVEKNSASHDFFFNRIAQQGSHPFGHTAIFNFFPWKGYGIYSIDGNVPGSQVRVISVPEESLSIFIYFNTQDNEAMEHMTLGILENFLGEKGKSDTEKILEQDHTLSERLGVFFPVGRSKKGEDRFFSTSESILLKMKPNGILVDEKLYKQVAPHTYYYSSTHSFLTLYGSSRGEKIYIALDGTLYQRRNVLWYPLFIHLFAMALIAINILSWVFIITHWKGMKYNRIHDTPRAVILVYTLLLSILCFFFTRLLSLHDIWYMTFRGFGAYQAVRWASILSLVMTLPVLIQLKRVGDDFRWNFYVKLTLWFQVFMAVTFNMWLIYHRFLI